MTNVSNWKPGMCVVTADDREEWRAWQLDSKLAAQRYRRSKYPRIDYHPGKEAHAVILANISNRAGGTYSSVIDSIIVEWASGIK